jgi:hypothetical protein
MYNWVIPRSYFKRISKILFINFANMPKRSKPESKEVTNDKTSKKAKTEPNILDKFKTKKEKLCFTEVKGNLFQCDDNVSLAHCVSLDFKMGAGIAVEFKKRFKGTGELTDQGKS